MQSHDRQRHILRVKENGTQETYILEASMYSVGRDPSCDIVFKSKSISRHHAMLIKIKMQTGSGTTHRYKIVDGDSHGRPSANGIRVNGQPCRQKNLNHGDRLLFGDSIQAQYEVIDSAAALDHLKDTVKVPKFRSVKLKTQDHFPTVMDDDLEDVILVTVQSVLPAQENSSPKLIALSPDNHEITVDVLATQLLTHINPGDQVRVAKAGDSYLLLGQLDEANIETAEQSPSTAAIMPTASAKTSSGEVDLEQTAFKPNKPSSENLVALASPEKAAARSSRKIAEQPPDVSTLMQDLLEQPELSLGDKKRKLLHRGLPAANLEAAKQFRRCYEAVLQELNELELSESSYVAIANTLFMTLHGRQ